MRRVHFRSFCLGALACFAVALLAGQSEPKGGTEAPQATIGHDTVFMLDLAVVGQYKPEGEATAEVFAKLPARHAEFIAKFWRVRANMASFSYMDYLAALRAQQAGKAESEAKINDIRGDFQSDLRYMRWSYYYDQWPQIVDMIERAASLPASSD